MAQDRLTGTLFDRRYQIQKRIGSGGMANVYLAEDQSLHRLVAIKVLNDRFSEDEQFVERFSREASAAARLNHPNIVQVYDRGEADGAYYIAMEYVDGPTLKQIVTEQGPLSEAHVYSYAQQALNGLRFAHKNGVIHRDVKPHNFMVNDEGRVKIADFGIARAGADKGLTEVGSIIGTAQYLSPEQARGEHVTGASDLYSMGVVLYEMITGRVPFDGDAPVNIAIKHVNDPPPVPSTFRPGLSPQLEAVVMKALAKHPEDRYETADDFLEDLRRAREGTLDLTAMGATGMATQVIAQPMRMPDPQTQSMAAQRAASTAYDGAQTEKRRIWPWILAVALLLAIGVAAYFALGGSDKGVAVPDVVGLTSNQAAARIRDAGLVVGQVDQTASDKEPGTVVSQDPEGGKLDKGEAVDLEVSSGPATGSVPDLVGKKLSAAQTIASDAGFELQVRHSNDPTVPKGSIISQDPGAGSSADEGSTITVIVSDGPEQVTVPSLTGRTRAQAEQAVVDAGLKVGQVTQEYSSDPVGTVIDQDPSPGTKVPQGSSVDILISKGPEPTDVPDVVGQDSTSAQDQLEAAGFQVQVNEVGVNDPSLQQSGPIVSEQDPASGAQAAKGSTVTLTVERYDPKGSTPQ